MPSKKVSPRHGRTGRPAYDDLQLFARIEAGRRLAGQSVYAYTRHRCLPVWRAGKGSCQLAVISGNSLHGHYYRIKRNLCASHAGPEALPAVVERLVAEMMIHMK